MFTHKDPQSYVEAKPEEEVGGMLLSLFCKVSISMKPCPSFVRTYTGKFELRPVRVLFEPTNLDEVSNRIPPTSH